MSLRLTQITHNPLKRYSQPNVITSHLSILSQPSGAHSSSGGDGAANGSGGTAANGSSNGGGEPAFSLFAYPAYDNFSGKMNPAEWVKAVQAKSTPEHQWKVRAGRLCVQGRAGGCY